MYILEFLTFSKVLHLGELRSTLSGEGTKKKIFADDA